MRDALTPEQYAALAAAPPQGHGPWTRGEMLLASVVDAVRVGNWQFATANGAKSSTPPEPVRRPGVERAGNVRAISPEGRAYLQRIRERRGEG